MAYLYLALAILAEVTATSFLKASEEFTRLVPSLIVVAGYALAFYFLTLTLRFIPIGITYAVWAGLGIVLIALVGYLFYKEPYAKVRLCFITRRKWMKKRSL